MSVPIIIDTDPGHDDAIAILLALASPELDVKAITTVAGNATLDKTTRNALKVLELVGRTDIPVAPGASQPLTRELETAEYVHGATGLDGPVLPDPLAHPVDVGAVDLIASLAADGPLSLVPVGPLTNVAQLLRAHPEVTSSIQRIVLMGGSIGLGNVTPAAEFNIYVDPEAAAEVFGSPCDVTMIGLDVTHRALLRRQHAEHLRTTGPVGRFVADLLAFFMARYEHVFGEPIAPIHDAAAVAHLIAPDLIETIELNVEVETGSALTRGRTVVDRLGVTGRPPNAHVAVDIDGDRFADMLVERLESLDR